MYRASPFEEFFEEIAAPYNAQIPEPTLFRPSAMHARVLRYLDEVVRRGSIRRAAETLHVAPTAINRQILELEAELGAPLFDRIHKRLHLTPLGEAVLAHVRQTLREHAALQARVAEIKGARRGMVTVATT